MVRQVYVDPRGAQSTAAWQGLPKTGERQSVPTSIAAVGAGGRDRRWAASGRIADGRGGLDSVKARLPGPHGVPGVLLVVGVQVIEPDVDEVVPFLQGMLGTATRLVRYALCAADSTGTCHSTDASDPADPGHSAQARSAHAGHSTDASGSTSADSPAGANRCRSRLPLRHRADSSGARRKPRSRTLTTKVTMKYRQFIGFSGPGGEGAIKRQSDSQAPDESGRARTSGPIARRAAARRKGKQKRGTDRQGAADRISDDRESHT